VFDQPLNQIYSVRVPYELPAENALILNNGRRIGYKQLVLATGIKHDFTQIKGFYEALEDPEHPVYASKGKKIQYEI